MVDIDLSIIKMPLERPAFGTDPKNSGGASGTPKTRWSQSSLDPSDKMALHLLSATMTLSAARLR